MTGRIGVTLLCWTQFFLFFAPPLWAQSFSTIQSNNDGIEALKKEDVPASLNLFVEALHEEPENAGIHLNLGIALEFLKEAEKSLKAYKLAETYAKSDVVKFASYFNQARVHSTANAYQTAVELYQKALDIDPTSYEAKANIEMLVQQKKSGGGGEGKDDKKKDQKKDDQKKKYQQNPKPTPIPFKSKKLSKRDVKKIFEELLQQEQKIRKEEDRKKPKEKTRDKDW